MTLLDDLAVLAESKKVSRRIFKLLEKNIVAQLQAVPDEDDDDDDE